MAKEIQLSNSKGVVIVDDEDYQYLSQFKWHGLSNNRHYLYVYRCVRLGKNKYKRIFIHREVLNASEGVLVDHINGNTFDNRRVNLRLCNNAENIRNSKKSNGKTSEFKGVSFQKERRKWIVGIRIPCEIGRGKSISIGRFSDEVHAAKMYDKAATKYFGAFARLNFPANGEN